MPLALVHNPVAVPPTATGDNRDFLTRPAVQAEIASAHNGSSHLLAGATTGDILVATSPVTLGVIAAPATGRVLISNGAGAAPSWSASPTITTATVTTVTASGAITSSSPSAGIGYAAGAGAAVTQITSRTTGVTVNAISGTITTDTTSLAAEAAAAFVVTNSSVAIGDVVVVSQRSGAVGAMTDVVVVAVAAGSFTLSVMNNNPAAGVAETGAIIINFAVIKAVSA